MNSNYVHANISTYGEARHAAFCRNALENRLRALQGQAEDLSRKIAFLSHCGMETEVEMLSAQFDQVQLRIQEHKAALDAGADLVATIAPRMLAWAS